MSGVISCPRLVDSVVRLRVLRDIVGPLGLVRIVSGVMCGPGARRPGDSLIFGGWLGAGVSYGKYYV